jgi:hypothetical protein
LEDTYEGLQVRAIKAGAFKDCETLEKITFSNSLTNIGEQAFSNCDNLRTVMLSGSLTEIGDAVFYDCDGLTSVTLTENIQHISETAFEGCDRLSFKQLRNTKFLGTANNDYYALIEFSNKNAVGYKMETGTTLIADGAFDECTLLTTLDIPSTVKYVGYGAFEDCSLNAVYYHGTSTEWNAIQLEDNNAPWNLAKVYYYSETFAEGNYWHYDEYDNIVIWNQQVDE